MYISSPDHPVSLARAIARPPFAHPSPLNAENSRPRASLARGLAGPKKKRGRRTSRYRRRPGLLLRCLFWSSGHALAPLVPVRFFPPCAQLLWCELYDMKDVQKKENKRGVHRS